MKHQTAEEHLGTFTNKQRTIALAILGMAFVMDLLDSTIVNIAIPSIQTNLGASYATIQWLVAGYALTFALLLITGGRMGDVFGYKKTFLVGVSGFTIASLLCGTAHNSEILVAARLLQGSMAALMVPQVMSLMQVMYKKEERGKAMGLFGMLGGMAATLGPILGGVLIEANLFHWSWRPIFLINVPIGVVAFFAAVKFLPNSKSPHPLRMDLKGTAVLVVALGLLIFPLIQGRELSWPAWIWWMLAASVPALVLFALYERRKDKKDASALVVPSLFRLPTFSRGLLLNLLLQITIMGFFLTFTISLQLGLGFSVLKTALIGIPTAIGIGGSIAMGQKLVPKLGRYVISIGAAMIGAGLIVNAWIINHYGLSVSGWQFMPALLVAGVGMGCIMAVMYSVTFQDVDPRNAGSASGVMSAIQQIGAAIGVALIGAVFFGHLASGANQAFDKVTPQLKKNLATLHVPEEAQQQIVASTRACFHDRNAQKDNTKVPASCQQMQQSAPSEEVSAQLQKTVQSAAHQANAHNFGVAYKWGIGLGLSVLSALFILSFFLPEHFKMVEETTA